MVGIKTLERWLAYQRPHGSEVEELFLNELRGYLPDATIALGNTPITGKLHGNIIVWIGRSRDTDTLFSCHVDTIHREQAISTPVWDNGVFRSGNGKPLGADDTAGVWLMVNMIHAGVPGVYIFHRGEERGGIGSLAMANKEQIFLKTFKRAIAFDRKGYGSVITHQAGGRCCSHEFALTLSNRLGGKFFPDDTGLFTDTANYIYTIPECTNISCGYFNEHTRDETLDVVFLVDLLDKVLSVDWEKLPTVRNVEEDDCPDDTPPYSLVSTIFNR